MANNHERLIPERLIPDPVRAEVKVQVQLPAEAQAILQDLHRDRQTIGIGGAIMLGCTIIMTLKSLLGKRE